MTPPHIFLLLVGKRMQNKTRYSAVWIRETSWFILEKFWSSADETPGFLICLYPFPVLILLLLFFFLLNHCCAAARPGSVLSLLQSCAATLHWFFQSTVSPHSIVWLNASLLSSFCSDAIKRWLKNWEWSLMEHQTDICLGGLTQC